MNKLIITAAVAAAAAMPTWGELSDATVGFYTFNDAEPGTVVTSVANVYPDGTMAAASVTAGNGGKTAISAERPGKYIYEGPIPIVGQLMCSEPQSLRLGEGAMSSSNKSGLLAFGDAAKVLSPGHSGAGYTYEFFFRADSIGNWDYQIAADLGYWWNSTEQAYPSDYYPIRITMPYPDNKYLFRAALHGYDRGPYKGSNVNASNLIPGFTSFTDGQWHHFAQVETVDAEGVPKVSFYVDHVLMSTMTLAKGVIDARQVSSGRVQLGYANSWNAAISCVRFSTRALSVDELLYASEQAEMPADTVAYYGFDDGEIGASAVGSATIRNLMAPSVGAGTVTLQFNGNRDNNPTATFDAEGPGNYLYHGIRQPGVLPLFEGVRSLKIDSDASYSAMVEFMGLATEISKLHATGSTVEFFMKFKGDNVLEWDQIVYYLPGYRIDGAEKDFRIYLPAANSTSYAQKVIYSLGAQDYDTGKCIGTLPANPATDGKWHHIAIVETPGEEGAATVSVWVDYVRYGERTIDSTFEQTASRSLQLDRYRNRAKYAALRVTGRPLDASEFLRAYESLPQGLLIKMK